MTRYKLSKPTAIIPIYDWHEPDLSEIDIDILDPEGLDRVLTDWIDARSGDWGEGCPGFNADDLVRLCAYMAPYLRIRSDPAMKGVEPIVLPAPINF